MLSLGWVSDVGNMLAEKHTSRRGFRQWWLRAIFCEGHVALSHARAFLRMSGSW